MNREEVLDKAIQKAVNNGWSFPKWVKDCAEDSNYLPYSDYLYPCIIFDHDFARALWKGAKTPDAKEGEPSYDAIEVLGLYKATGGGYEGYGDYVNLEFTGEPWQYHLQQMVISPDPIKYLGDNI